MGCWSGGGINSGFAKAVKSKKTPRNPPGSQVRGGHRKQPTLSSAQHTQEKARLQGAQEEMSIQRPPGIDYNIDLLFYQ